MITKTITYVDFKGIERTEDFHFHFKRSDLVDMEHSTAEGFSSLIEKLINAKDLPEVIGIFKYLILEAYGEISPDGRRFMKSEEIKQAFSETEAYSQFFMELATDAKAAAEFVNGVMPAMTDEEKEAIQKMMAEKNMALATDV